METKLNSVELRDDEFFLILEALNALKLQREFFRIFGLKKTDDIDALRKDTIDAMEYYEITGTVVPPIDYGTG